jgi:hypothetical protein
MNKRLQNSKKGILFFKEAVYLIKNRKNISLNAKYFDSSKKKIRGWKRRVKEVNKERREVLETVPIEYFKLYDKPTIACDEFISRIYSYQFTHPYWFFKNIVKHLVTAYDSWDKAFKELNEPYDLQLRLFDPHNFESILRCIKVKNHGDKYYWWPPSNENKPFPFDKFQRGDYDLTRFDWELCMEEEVIFESELENKKTSEQILLSRGWEKTENENEAYFTKQIGDVWIGRKKNLL